MAPILPSTASTSLKVLVLSIKRPELSILKQLPSGSEVLGTGANAADFAALTDEQLASVNVLLCYWATAAKATIQALWPKLASLQWVHTASAGLEHLLVPELVEGHVVLTNGRGTYSHALAEYTLAACNWFAKDLPRYKTAQKQKKWEPFEIEELRGRTFGVIGYGDIGQACAKLAGAYKMRVVALRQRTQLTIAELKEGLVDRVYRPDQLGNLLEESDYVVMATPWTPATDKLLSAEAISRMKPNAVFINVGRGKCVDEPALIKALQEHRIRGAALDVFATEPLPEDSPLWELDNVLISPHSGCRRKEESNPEGLQFYFLENAKRFLAGQELLNVVDKQSGY